MKVLIVRHGETEENRKGITTGQKPGRLTSKGRAHARMLAERLSRMGVDAIVSSDLKRCRDTVAIIRKRVKVPVSYTEALREISSGIYDGKPQQKLRDAMASSKASRLRFKPRGGESLLEFRARVRAFVRKLKRDWDLGDRTIVLCTHSAWTNEFLRALGRKPSGQAVVRVEFLTRDRSFVLCWARSDAG